MKVAIIPNLTKSSADKFTKKCVKRLLELNLIPMLTKDNYIDVYGKEINKNIDVLSTIEQLVRCCDVVITIGGDGTIINTASYTSKANKPLLGINLGTLGFVAELECDELDKLKHLVDGDYNIDKRMMIKATVNQGDEQKVYHALNDINISRGALSRIIDLSVSLNDEEISNYRADGLIFSTPTGSTAYSLSAGGPVIEPRMKCILLTPVCPHSLFARSVLFSKTSVIEVSACNSDTDEIYLTIDGQHSIKLDHCDTITIETSELSTKLISINNKNFYRILDDKLHHRTN